MKQDAQKKIISAFHSKARKLVIHKRIINMLCSDLFLIKLLSRYVDKISVCVWGLQS